MGTMLYTFNYKRAKVNIAIIILLMISGIFSYRVISILNSNNERGAFAYVELLNFGIPIVENQVYDGEDFTENKLSIKKACLEATGIYNINAFNIINSEVCYFKFDLPIESTQKLQVFSPFELKEEALIKINDEDVNDLKKPLNQSNPEILIYHTHTTESYAEDGPDTENQDYNVVGVGNVLEEELENTYGIACIHDKTNHSVSYLKCYERSNETVTNYLKKYGDFKLIIDVHRDSVDNKSMTTATVNGQSVVKVMYVNAKNSTRYENNKKLAEFFENRTEELYPGMSRGIYTYNSGKNAFNQSLSDNSILIEFGSNVNTSIEAKNSAKCLARIIAEYVNR